MRLTLQIPENDVRRQDGFLAKLGQYVKLGFSAGRMWREFSRDFPHADMPSSPDAFNTLLREPKTWSSFVELFGYEPAEQLWEKNQVRIRKMREQDTHTLKELLSRVA